jgi:hypothetical protein
MNQSRKHNGEEAYRDKTVAKQQVKGKEHRSFKQNWRKQLTEDMLDQEEIEFYPPLGDDEV